MLTVAVSNRRLWRVRPLRQVNRCRHLELKAMSVRDLLIIGAGPAGLAVAIAAAEAQLDYEIIEKGTLVNSIFHFPPGMTFFTTPLMPDRAYSLFVTLYEKPTRHEALRYYRRVADAFQFPTAFAEEVEAITRDTEAGAPVFIVDSRSERGVRRGRHARAVVFAIGYDDHPNILGIPGEDLPHVQHYYGDPHAHYRERVLVVGGKNSAAIALLELYRAGAQVTLVHRGATLSDRIKYQIRPDITTGSTGRQCHFQSRVEEIDVSAIVVHALRANERRFPPTRSCC